MVSLRSLAVVLGVFASTVSAQTLSGRVPDAATGAPLPGAAVRVLEAAAATDADGRFALRGLPADTATVVVSFVGYDTWRGFVDLRQTRS
ncbi:carboxypeptidase-like regulatory domain-containing protein, partial [Rubrivirga sp.]|uniref:carboxypeptidase-like regulatory domain-containing protein n=1 Tax=Rubrivirga sp. TaxID=1885344 RepID=UPI003C723B78